ncbi:hypothetical protein FF1_043029 [Malus domestica]
MWASLMGRTKKWLSRSHKWLRPIEHKPNSPLTSRASEHVVARAHRATKILKAEETQTCLESNNHTMAAPAIEWILRAEKDGGGSELLQAQTRSDQDQRLPNQAGQAGDPRSEKLIVGTLITRPSAPGGIDNPMENLAVRVAGLGCSKLLLESAWKGQVEGDQDHFSIETEGRSPRRDCILTF